MAVAPHPHAEAALACLAGQGGERHKGRRFSSDLSVDEAVLLKEIGYEPRGLVVGAAVYHIGLPTRNWSVNEEVQQLTDVMNAGRAEALNWVEDRAQQIGGQGIIGLKLEVHIRHSRHQMAEFVATGTAVANPQQRVDRMWLSDLSGQDLYLLTKAGYVPTGLAVGTCVFHVAHQAFGQFVARTTQNVELGNYTEALYAARELAMERMQREANNQRASGIVAMRAEQKSHAWGSHVIEFLAIGTAVRLAATEHQRLNPTMVVTLNDGDPETALPRSVAIQE
ncbi:MAG: heavy metal-binding domain-containing protein [Solirubrobacteraceae bacterium]